MSRPASGPRRRPLGRGRGRSLLRAVVTLAVVTACRGSHAIGATGSGVLDPEQVDPAFASDWQAVRDAQAKDPAGQAIVVAADRLLARSPPLDLRLAALHAKATQGLQRGEYPGAIGSARAGAEEVSKALAQGGELSQSERELASQLARAGALAEAEAGDPQVALQTLGALAESARGPEFFAATGRARERLGDRAGAALAYAQWRGAVAEGSPEAAVAEARLHELLPGLDAAALEAAARKAPGTPAAQCLLARGGREAPAGAPAWVSACQPTTAAAAGGGRIGLLLPRSGKFAGLADEQLAAATAALRVLAGKSAEQEVAWRDAGSDPAEARQAAQALIGGGAEVLVGPVGANNIEAAAEVVAGSGGRVRLIVPGEATGAAVGAAPTLEARATKLAETVGRLRRTTAVIFAPENSYGKRAVAALEKSLPKSGVTALKIFYYPPSTTSFAKIVDPARAHLKGAAILVPDQVGRVELLLRQLVRDGVVVEGPKQPGAPVLSTGEGAGPKTLGAGHEILEGVYLAPVAWPTPDAAAFADTYAAMEGEAPGDQAWLVWRAFARAWSSVELPPPQAAVLRVEGGRLVATEASASIGPEERPNKAR